MDRRAGATSSVPCKDLERVFRDAFDESFFSDSPMGRSLSDSDSDDAPEAEALDAGTLFNGFVEFLRLEISPSFSTPSTPLAASNGEPPGARDPVLGLAAGQTKAPTFRNA